MLPEITRLRAEVENLRRVRDAAQEVVGVLGEQYMAGAKLWFPALDDLRAALDAEKRQADSTADHDNPSNHAGK